MSLKLQGYMAEFQASLTHSFASGITENPVSLPHTTEFIKVTELFQGEGGGFCHKCLCLCAISQLNKMKWRNTQKLSNCPIFLTGFYREQPALIGWRKKRCCSWNGQKRVNRWQNDVFLCENSPRLNSMCQGKITHSHAHMISSALQETGFDLMFG